MKITIDKSRLKRINALVKNISNGTLSGLWATLKTWLTDIKNRMFDKGGGEYGRSKWPPISPTLIGKIRRGSDGSIQGRYSASSKPLQASGTYRTSFKFLETPQTLEFKSTHPKAADLPYGGWNKRAGRYDPRYVLPDVTSRQYTRELRAHVKTSIKKWLTEVK